VLEASRNLVEAGHACGLYCDGYNARDALRDLEAGLRMIVFWTGWGILALFVPLICFPLLLFAAYKIKGNVGDWDDESALIGSAWMISALACWVLGRFLNSRKAKILKDPDTGEETAVRRSNTFMFMEMQWAGVLYGLAGAWFFVKSLLG